MWKQFRVSQRFALKQIKNVAVTGWHQYEAKLGDGEGASALPPTPPLNCQLIPSSQMREEINHYSHSMFDIDICTLKSGDETCYVELLS